MRIHQARFRQLHRTLAPIMVLPILLTLLTGSVYQIVTINGQGADFNWLLNWHKGQFGFVNLERIYPFFNALGLLTLVITGIQMWFGMQRHSKRSP